MQNLESDRDYLEDKQHQNMMLRQPNKKDKPNVPQLDMDKINENREKKQGNDGTPEIEDIDDDSYTIKHYQSRSMIENPTLKMQDYDTMSSKQSNKDRSNGKSSHRIFESQRSDILRCFYDLNSKIKNPVYQLLQSHDQVKLDQLKTIFSILSQIHQTEQESIIGICNNNKAIQKPLQTIVQLSSDQQQFKLISKILGTFKSFTQQQKESTIKIIDPCSLRETSRHNIITPKQSTKRSHKDNEDKEFNAYLKNLEPEAGRDLITDSLPTEEQLLLSEHRRNNTLQENVDDNMSEIHLIQGKRDEPQLILEDDNKNAIKAIQNTAEKNDELIKEILEEKIKAQNSGLTYLYGVLCCRKQAAENKANLDVIDSGQTSRSTANITISDEIKKEQPQAGVVGEIKEQQNFVQRIFNVCRTKKDNRIDLKADLKEQHSDVIESEQTSRSKIEISIKDKIIEEINKSDAKDKIEDKNSRLIYLYAVLCCRKKAADNKKVNLEIIKHEDVQEIEAKNNTKDADTTKKKEGSCCNFTNFLRRQSAYNSKKEEGVKMD